METSKKQLIKGRISAIEDILDMMAFSFPMEKEYIDVVESTKAELSKLENMLEDDNDNDTT